MAEARWLILSDVHSNLEALDAVLRDADARWGVLPIACAGDVVGLQHFPGGAWHQPGHGAPRGGYRQNAVVGLAGCR